MVGFHSTLNFCKAIKSLGAPKLVPTFKQNQKDAFKFEGGQKYANKSGVRTVADDVGKKSQ